MNTTNNPGSVINTIIPTEVIVQGIINDYSNSGDPAHKVVASLMNSMMQIIAHMNNELNIRDNTINKLNEEVRLLTARVNDPIKNSVDSKTHTG